MKRSPKPADPSNSDQLAAIWSIIESRKTFPAVIVVTSATDADDTTTIARGLAAAAQQAGQRTGYLALGDNSAAEPHRYAELAIAARTPQREAFDAALPGWLSRFEVIIVNAPTLRSQPGGAHIARIADGVVIGLCKARKVIDADREPVAPPDRRSLAVARAVGNVAAIARCIADAYRGADARHVVRVGDIDGAAGRAPATFEGAPRGAPRPPRGRIEHSQD